MDKEMQHVTITCKSVIEITATDCKVILKDFHSHC